MKSLVLTLGHNSSAVVIEDGHILGGYENERITGIKSDSQFPRQAIDELKKQIDLVGCNIYVSHWFLNGELPKDDIKHWDPDYIHTYFSDSPIYSHTPKCTHHDGHMWSAEVFVGEDFPDHHTLVVDGFGTHGECISVYYNRDRIVRYYGFHQSVGLLYQYATDFCGMKMHQDEYKMLGYETLISTLDVDIDQLNYIIDYVDNFFDTTQGNHKETDLTWLSYTKEVVHGHLNKFILHIETQYYKKFGINEIRILISYYVQRHLENVISGIVKGLNPTNLVVSGGVFYNVKLNSLLCDMVLGKFSVMPLAGDQGAGLGVYEYYNQDLIWPEHLFWGKRSLLRNEDDICKNLYQNGMVNLIRGSMEFGPRALGNTSTLAIPIMENVNKINKMNNRTTIMPMALVVTEEQAQDLFVDIDKVHKSLEYMVMARDFKPGKHIGLEGGALFYPHQMKWTCRPQITTDSTLIDLLNTFGPLINTSANYHGQPIVFSMDQIQFMNDKQNEIYPINTIISED